MDVRDAELREALAALVADRHSPEARALYVLLLRFAGERVQFLWRSRYRDLLSAEEIEDIVGDVGLVLASGALARFEGGTPAELRAFVRTIAERVLLHRVHRRLKERELVAEEDWARPGKLPRPEQAVELEPPCPLSERDRRYLEDLLRAGSQAALARQRGQSRAAVTRMLHRIRQRVDALGAVERDAARVWLEQRARGLGDG